MTKADKSTLLSKPGLLPGSLYESVSWLFFMRNEGPTDRPVAIISPMAPTALPSQQTPAKGCYCPNCKSANLPPPLPSRSSGLHHIPIVSRHSVLLPCPVARPPSGRREWIEKCGSHVCDWRVHVHHGMRSGLCSSFLTNTALGVHYPKRIGHFPDSVRSGQHHAHRRLRRAHLRHLLNGIDAPCHLYHQGRPREAAPSDRRRRALDAICAFLRPLFARRECR